MRCGARNRRGGAIPAWTAIRDRTRDEIFTDNRRLESIVGGAVKIVVGVESFTRKLGSRPRTCRYRLVGSAVGTEGDRGRVRRPNACPRRAVAIFEGAGGVGVTDGAAVAGADLDEAAGDVCGWW